MSNSERTGGATTASSITSTLTCSTPIRRSTRNPETSPNEAGGGFKLAGEKQIDRIVAFANYTYNTAEGGGISTTFSRHTAVVGVAYLRPFDVQGEVAVGVMWSQLIPGLLPTVERRSQSGVETSTRYVRIRASAISRRTSSWLEEQGQRPAMQRAGTLRYMGPPRPGPLLNRPRGDKCSEQGRPSQANRGPKNLGSSLAPIYGWYTEDFDI